MNNTITILHPALESASDALPAASEAARPDGRPQRESVRPAGVLRLALLDNTKVNAIELFDAVARRLQQCLPVEVRRWRKRHAGESGADIIADIMQWKPQLVLTGLGD